MIKEVKISCDVKLFLPVEDLNEFQGNLKTLSSVNYEKLKKQILDEGFSAPIFVWQDKGKWWILDGHQRKHVILKLKAEGYAIPSLPCVQIHASTKKAAKKKLLTYVAQFGKVDGQGLYEYIMESELSLEELKEVGDIADINMEDFQKEYFAEVAEVGFPDLKDTDEPDIKQMTFMLHKDQVNEIERAIEIAKGMGDFGVTGNENSNGNALARVAELFIHTHENKS